MFDKRYYSLAHIIQYPMLIPVMLVFTLDSSDMSKNDYSQLSSFITLIPSNVSVLTFIRLSLTFLCSCSTDSTCFERSRQNRIITTITMILSSLTHLNYTSSNTSHLHLKPQHHNRDNDLEGTRPQCLKIANNEMSDEFSRGNILESLTVYFHKIHDFTLIVS